MSEAAAFAMDKEADLVALDEALVELSEMDRRKAQVVDFVSLADCRSRK